MVVRHAQCVAQEPTHPQAGGTPAVRRLDWQPHRAYLPLMDRLSASAPKILTTDRT